MDNRLKSGVTISELLTPDFRRLSMIAPALSMADQAVFRKNDAPAKPKRNDRRKVKGRAWCAMTPSTAERFFP
jgi:hypothetical protein